MQLTDNSKTLKNSHNLSLDMHKTDQQELDLLRKKVDALQAENEVLMLMLDSIPEYISYVDKELVYRVCNKKYETEASLTREDLIGKHVSEFIGEQTFDKIKPYVNNVLEGEQVTYDNRIDYKYLPQQDVKVQYIPHLSAEGEVLGFTTYVHNITSQKRAEELLRQQALHDPLTNLPNRTLFNEQLKQAIARADRSQSRLGIMFIDIDRFKQVNDRLGHDIGDQVLRDIANYLKQNLRQNDTLARYGGDEFVLLVDELQSQQQITILAKKMGDALSKMHLAALKDIEIGASIGIAIYPDHGDNPQDLLILADKAMYKSKSQGQGGYTLYSDGL